MIDQIKTEIQDGICKIQINRPEKKNAINQPMYAALAEGLRQADEDPEARVVVIYGHEGFFCAGNDIKDFQNRASSSGESSKQLSESTSFAKELQEIRKPVIAAVRGYAIGIGVTMLLHCDMVYAGKSAVFSMPFVNLGLCPELGSTYLLQKIAGRLRASELFFLGDQFSANKAFEYGIVNQVFPDDTLLDNVFTIAGRVASQPPAAIRSTKKLLRGYYSQAVADAIMADGTEFWKRLATPESAEAFAAFFERRKPDFSKFE